MDLVIIHYHLNRGGVTRVIENHLLALAQTAAPPTRVFVLFGGRQADWNRDVEEQVEFPVELVAVPELDYDEQRTGERELGEALLATLHDHSCQRGSTLLHVHNHSLGKNSSLPSALVRMAGDGWKLLLQIHDFAEDLRPRNYQTILNSSASKADATGQLYPTAEQIHYAVLNSCDRQRLLAAGIDEARLHYLPNAVVNTSGEASADRGAVRAKLSREYQVPPNHRYIIYPVRGIRRKNLGEFLLWAAMTEQATFGVTLAPLNPVERESYDRWCQLAEKLNLPVLMEAGRELSLDENLAAADALMTTSIAEGFGLVFLEASLARRPLFGRDLPGVTTDFREAGMRFPGLAETFAIPIDWIDIQSLRESLHQQLQQLADSFGVSFSAGAWADEFDRILGGDVIDFGRLNSSVQAELIERVVADKASRQELQGLNPKHDDMFSGDAELFGANIEAIHGAFSVERIGDRLQLIYDSLMNAVPSKVERNPGISTSVLESFVHPRSLFPIRLEP